MSIIGFEARPLARKDIRRFAMQVREALGYADRPYIDVEEVIDFVLPKALPDFAYGVGTMSEMASNHGLAYPDGRFIMIREDVFDRACDGRGRDRLTVFHELGHVLLHTPDRIVLRRGEGAPRKFRDPEWQANCFAGELLAAHTLVNQFTTVQEVALGFGMSLDAAEYQMRRFREEGLL